MNILKVNRLAIDICQIAAKQSKDSDTQVGAVLFDGDNPVSIGYNGIARGVKDLPWRLNRPEKYNWMVHAEMNCITNAARNGVKTLGTTLYVNRYPCLSCASAIVNAGIKKIYVTEAERSLSSRCDVSEVIFEESGIEVEQL